MSSAARPAPTPEEALNRVRRLFPQRRRWRGGVVLVVVVLLVAGALALSYRHLGATFQLGAFDGSVQWSVDSGSWTHGGATTVSLANRFLQKTWLFVHGLPDRLDPVANLHWVESLDLTNCHSLSNQELAVLKRLPHLRVLRMGRSNSSWLRGWPADHQLDTVAAYLAYLTEIQELDLSGTDLTDAGVKHLVGLKNLKVLDLERTGITDAGLKRLEGLPKLEELRLEGTKVTATAVLDLSRRRPELILDHPALLPPIPTESSAP